MIFIACYAYLVMGGTLPWDLTYISVAAMADGLALIVLLSE